MIIIKNPNEAVQDYIVGQFPCCPDSDAQGNEYWIIPSDCLELLEETYPEGVEYATVVLSIPYMTFQTSPAPGPYDGIRLHDLTKLIRIIEQQNPNMIPFGDWVLEHANDKGMSPKFTNMMKAYLEWANPAEG